MLGLEKILDKIFEVGGELLLPFEVINHYDRGVRLRFGRAVLENEKPKILEPGLHWKIPFVDQINSIMVKVSTMDLPTQLVTTKDGKAVLVGSVLKYDVTDVGTLLLEVDSPKAAVEDMAQGILKQAVLDRTWEECNTVDLEKDVTIKVRREAKKWGIDVKSFTLTNLMLIEPRILINTR